MAGPGRAVPDGTRSLTCRTKDIMVLTKRFKLGEEEDGYGSSPTANRVVMVQSVSRERGESANYEDTRRSSYNHVRSEV